MTNIGAEIIANTQNPILIIKNLVREDAIL